jgi:hypothetical protein
VKHERARQVFLKTLPGARCLSQVFHIVGLSHSVRDLKRPLGVLDGWISAMSTTKMPATHADKIAVSILGGTGLVGRALAGHLLDHPLFRLDSIHSLLPPPLPSLSSDCGCRSMSAWHTHSLPLSHAHTLSMPCESTLALRGWMRVWWMATYNIDECSTAHAGRFQCAA